MLLECIKCPSGGYKGTCMAFTENVIQRSASCLYVAKAVIHNFSPSLTVTCVICSQTWTLTTRATAFTRLLMQRLSALSSNEYSRCWPINSETATASEKSVHSGSMQTKCVHVAPAMPGQYLDEIFVFVYTSSLFLFASHWSSLPFAGTSFRVYLGADIKCCLFLLRRPFSLIQREMFYYLIRYPSGQKAFSIFLLITGILISSHLARFFIFTGRGRSALFPLPSNCITHLKI